MLVAMSFQPIMAMAKSDEASNEMNVKVSTQNVPVEGTNRSTRSVSMYWVTAKAEC